MKERCDCLFGERQNAGTSQPGRMQGNFNSLPDHSDDRDSPQASDYDSVPWGQTRHPEFTQVQQLSVSA